MPQTTGKSGYTLLVDRLNRFPQGAPPSRLLDKILGILFSDTEARLNPDICLGCGLCVRACSEGSLKLKPLAQRIITPLNGAHRAVVMAIEREKLHHLIFDNQVLFSHRALAAVLGVILKLPPVKQVLAGKQLKSRYLEALITRLDHADLI